MPSCVRRVAKEFRTVFPLRRSYAGRLGAAVPTCATSLKVMADGNIYSRLFYESGLCTHNEAIETALF